MRLKARKCSHACPDVAMFLGVPAARRPKQLREAAFVSEV